jgi:hypothetical protein
MLSPAETVLNLLLPRSVQSVSSHLKIFLISDFSLSVLIDDTLLPLLVFLLLIRDHPR